MAPEARLAVTWLELLTVLLITLGGLGVWAAADWGVGLSLRESEPQEDEIASLQGVPDRERQLAKVEGEWKTTLALLIQQRLEVERQAARLQLLLQAGPPGTAEAGSPYRESWNQWSSAAILEGKLKRHLDELEPTLGVSQHKARAARRSAALAFARAKEKFAWKRRLETLAWSVGGSVVLLLLAALLLSGHRPTEFGIRWRLVLGASLALLSVLYGYQLLREVAVVVATILVLLGMGAALRSLGRQRGSAAGKS